MVTVHSTSAVHQDVFTLFDVRRFRRIVDLDEFMGVYLTGSSVGFTRVDSPDDVLGVIVEFMPYFTRQPSASASAPANVLPTLLCLCENRKLLVTI